MEFTKDILKIDCESEAQRISAFIKNQLLLMRREGAVIGLSGGVDSALSAALCVKTLGKDKVLGLILPEKDSNPVSAQFAKKQAEKLGIKTETIDITPVLESFGAYQKRDKIVKQIFPEYNSGYKIKIALPPDLLSKDAFNFFILKMQDPNGKEKNSRLNKTQLNGIVAATCIKHRTRMTNLYYYAEKENYLVCGTTNKTEGVQGFFVKQGDGGVDIEPLAHLYKTQVYQLAEHLGVIKEILERSPSPDTFSFPVTDEEFYFRISFDKLDLLLYAWERHVADEKVCEVMGLSTEQVKRVFRDFTGKFNATRHLRQSPPDLNEIAPEADALEST